MSQESRLTRGIEKRFSHSAHLPGREIGDSGPVVDKALVLGDDLHSCWGSAVAKMTQKIDMLLCSLPTFLSVVRRNWT